MADSLFFAVARAYPVLSFWMGALAVGLVVGAAFSINDRARHLIADARLALDRADCSLDFTSRAAVMPACKLSDQLRGASPFTAMWRLFAADDLHESDFELEYLALRARRRGLTLVRADVGALITKLDDLLVGHKPMAKATIHERSHEQEQAS